MKLFDLANFGDKATQRLTLYGNIITLVGDQGSCNINIKGRASDSDHIKVCEFDTDLTTTAENFVSDNFLYYKLHGFIITASAGVITVNPAYGWETVNNIIVEVSTYTAPASATTAAPTTTSAGTTTAAPVTTTLTGIVSGTFEVDFMKSRIWRMTTGIDITVADPVNPANGDRVRLELRCTAGVTINFSSKWDFVGVSNYSLVNSAFSVIEGVYDSNEDKVICEITTYESITTTTGLPTTTAAQTTL